MNTKERNIIEKAVACLAEEMGTGIQAKMNEHPTKTKPWDAFIIINKRKIFIEAKNDVRPYHLNQLTELKEKLNDLILVADYIAPSVKLLLAEKGINYIDRVGNMRLKIDPVYIHIEGKANQPTVTHTKNRAFTKVGVKVVFQLLLNPELINTNYRNLAEQADVALGTIPKVIEGLKEEGYLVNKNKEQWILTNHKELLNRWQQEYNKRLKPALFQQTYTVRTPDFQKDWKKIKFREDTVWGGEPAGDLLTNYLKPEIFTIYTHETQMELMKKYRWIPDATGEVKVYQKFWKGKDTNNIAPAFLVYADLMDTNDSRCIETANLIYEQYLQKL